MYIYIILYIYIHHIWYIYRCISYISWKPMSPRWSRPGPWHGRRGHRIARGAQGSEPMAQVFVGLGRWSFQKKLRVFGAVGAPVLQCFVMFFDSLCLFILFLLDILQYLLYYLFYLHCYLLCIQFGSVKLKKKQAMGGGRTHILGSK